MSLLKLLSAFKDLEFRDEGHIYTLNGKRLRSVTTVKGKYGGFRKNYFLYKKALERLGHVVKSDLSKDVPKDHYNIDGELVPFELVLSLYDIHDLSREIEQQWIDTAEEGKCGGSLIHQYLEDRFQGKIFKLKPPCDREIYTKEEFKLKVSNQLRQAERFFQDYRHLIPIRCEYLVYDNDCSVAGQVDMLAYNQELDEIWLIDYKTDKKFRTYSEFKTKMKEPLSHLDDCELVNYSLQTHMYKYIIEKNTECVVNKILIVWFNEHDYSVIEPLDLSKEVKNEFNSN